jgi:hypothetical protein
MSLVGNVVESVSAGAGDAVGAAGDGADAFFDSVGGTGEWLGGEAEQLWDALEEGTVESMDALLDSIHREMDEILDGAWEGLSRTTEQLAEMPHLLAEEAIDQLGAVPDRLLAAMQRSIEDAFGLTVDAVETIQARIVDLSATLMTAFDEALASAWNGLLSNIEGAGRWLETLGAVLERIVLWLGRALRCVFEALAILGACLGGYVSYSLIKESILTLNAYREIRPFPRRFQDFCDDAFREFKGPLNYWLNWWNTWFIDHANLPQNLFGTQALGMALSNVSRYGVRWSHIVLLHRQFRLDVHWRVSNALHELVHVRQMVRLVHEDVFGCAYGAGIVIARGHMDRHPMEVEARKVECRYEQRIHDWTGDPTLGYAISPCDLTEGPPQLCVGLP